jgi:hypothetical protein
LRIIGIFDNIESEKRAGIWSPQPRFPLNADITGSYTNSLAEGVDLHKS